MRRYYMVLMANADMQQEVFIRRGFSEKEVMRDLLEERELSADDWQFDFVPLEEVQAIKAECDPEHYYLTYYG